MKKLISKLLGNDENREIKNSELLYFMLGVCGQNMTYNLIAGWFYYYCTDVVFLDVMAVGLVLGAARIWDAINDPIAGIVIDRHRFKNGEKLRPYLKITALPIGVFAMMMFIDVGLESQLILIFITIMYFLWDVLYSFQDIAMWGMTAMMASTSEERGRAAQFGRIGGSLGGWLPGLIPLLIGSKDLLGISEKTLFVIFAVVLGVGGMAISMFSYKAQERTPAPKVESKVSDDFKMIFNNKIVMLLVLGSILQSCTFSVQQIYFFKYMISLNVFGQTVNGASVMFVFGIVVGTPGTLCMLLANKIAKKAGGMKNVLIIAVVSNIVCRVISYFIGYDGYGFYIMALLLMLCGIPNGLMGIATTSMWGDSIDYMEWKTGKRNEGGTFAMQNFIAKLTSGIGIVFNSLTLTILQFDATLYEEGLPQSPVFYKWIWPIYILGPAVGSLLYMIPLLCIKYNINDRHKIEKELAKRRKLLAVGCGLSQTKYGEKYYFKPNTPPERETDYYM